MKRLAYILIAMMSCQLLLAQQKSFQVNDSTKIGLVLSGGGAKGFAHIGTLKVIDSLGIKVDYIAGTSMGAIIGSLYASGYSGKQLDSIFKSLNFDDVINDNLPREAKSFYEKRNADTYVISLPLNKFKVSLPSGISRGQNVYNLLSQLTLHVGEIKDFSKLPIPFFCMGTNVETGEAIQFESGNLAQVIQGSGAFPSLFQPVIIDDKVIIDGGVTNNYPIKKLKEKGMDIIIGVDVQDDLSTRKELKSADKILLQINNYRTINDMKEKSKITDIYIQPNIKDYTVISFDQGQDIVANGEKAAKEKLEELVTLVAPNRTNKQGIEPANTDKLFITAINFNGNKNYTRSYLLGKLKFKNKDTISYAQLVKGIDNIMATNNFDNFTYTLNKNDKGYDLMADVRESKQKAFLKLAIHYDDLYKSAILLNYTHKHLLTANDVMSLDVVLGDNFRYDLDYFIDKGNHWSFGVNSRYNTFHRNVDADLLLTDEQLRSFNINKIDSELQDLTNRIYVQTLFKKDFTFSIGAEHKYLKIASETLVVNPLDDEILFDNSNYLGFFGNLKLDTYDKGYFPTNGFYINGDFNWYVYSSDFNNNFSPFSIAKADLGYAFPINSKLSLNVKAQGGFKIGEDSNNSLNFAFGGYGRNFINNFYGFYGYDYVSISANSFVKTDVALDYEIFKKNHITLAANYANIENGLFKSGNWFSLPDYSGYAIGYGVETFIGPVEAKYTFSPETKRGFWFFNVGFWF